jgi:hypothetical protein
VEAGDPPRGASRPQATETHPQLGRARRSRQPARPGGVRPDYESIAAGRSTLGDFDPFGDFDLLLGAAKLGLKIIDLPVRYGARRYGSTNISRFQNGWQLLRMTVLAFWKLRVAPVRV